MNQIADDSNAYDATPTPNGSCRGVHMTRTSEQQRTDGMHRPPTVQQQAVTHTAAAMVEHASLLSLLSITILPHLSVHIMMSASARAPVSTAHAVISGQDGARGGTGGTERGTGCGGARRGAGGSFAASGRDLAQLPPACCSWLLLLRSPSCSSSSSYYLLLLLLCACSYSPLSSCSSFILTAEEEDLFVFLFLILLLQLLLQLFLLQLFLLFLLPGIPGMR